MDLIIMNYLHASFENVAKYYELLGALPLVGSLANPPPYGGLTLPYLNIPFTNLSIPPVFHWVTGLIHEKWRKWTGSVNTSTFSAINANALTYSYTSYGTPINKISASSEYFLQHIQKLSGHQLSRRLVRRRSTWAASVLATRPDARTRYNVLSFLRICCAP
jgi:hypothetical protein